MNAFALSRPALVGIVVVVLTTLLLVLHRLRRPDSRQWMQQRMEEDATQPLKRWVQSVFLIVTRDCDYAYISAVEAKQMMEDWWDIRNSRDFQAALGRLRAPGRPDHAWDLIRFILVARLGVAAGYWRDEESWRHIRPIALRLQRCYPSWAAMAQAYVHARRRWRNLAVDGGQDDAVMRWVVDNIARLRVERWPHHDFDEDFDEDPL